MTRDRHSGSGLPHAFQFTRCPADRFSAFVRNVFLFLSTPFRPSRIIRVIALRGTGSGTGDSGGRRCPGRPRNGSAVYRGDRQDPGLGDGQAGKA